jgi:hypothetical protein
MRSNAAAVPDVSQAEYRARDMIENPLDAANQA